jgi:hypothetical protein
MVPDRQNYSKISGTRLSALLKGLFVWLIAKGPDGIGTVSMVVSEHDYEPLWTWHPMILAFEEK